MATSRFARIFLVSILTFTALLTGSCAHKVGQMSQESGYAAENLNVDGRDGFIGGLFARNAGPQALSTNAKASEPSLGARKIIRNGSLELLVDDVGQAVSKTRATVERVGGYIENSTQTDRGVRRASMTVRVPAAHLDDAMSEIKRTAARVETEKVEARDVTREYIDLDARLHNSQAEEAQYLQILKRATTVKDTLEVTDKLSSVRGRIEQMQGEMKYLIAQIDMSSIAISIRSEADATVLGFRWRPLYQAKLAFVEMVSGLADWADSVVAFIIKLPLILVWLATILVLAVFGWRVVRFLWRKLTPRTGWKIPWFRSRSTGVKSA